MSFHAIQYGKTIIEYQVRYADRKTLAIHVEPDLEVHVVAPLETESDAIAARVRKRAAWILRQQRDFEQYLPHQPPREYVSGETHYYLGRQHRLKVISAEDDQVKLTRGYVQVQSTCPHDPDHTRDLVKSWYRRQAKRILRERLHACFPRVQRHDVNYPLLELREMRTRWGSCTASGKLLLNPILVQAPKDCIDYIVLHELCHLVEHNHSPTFYELLAQVCPDWQERREKLNQVPVSS